MTPTPAPKGTYQQYWDAIRCRACAACLDAGDDGSCGLAGERVCALVDRLPLILEAILSVDSPRMDEYVDAIEAGVCAQCRQDAAGRCALREKGNCALYAYLPLVVDAIEEVQQGGPA